MSKYKFEYWAKHEGLDCKLEKYEYTVRYADKTTETAYKSWCSATSASVNGEYNSYIARSDFSGQCVNICFDAYIAVVSEITDDVLSNVEQFNDFRKQGDDFTYILSTIKGGSKIIVNELRELHNLIGVTELIRGVISKNYPRKTCRVQETIDRLHLPMAWGHGLEKSTSIAISSKIFIKDKLELRFNDKFMEAVISKQKEQND